MIRAYIFLTGISVILIGAYGMTMLDAHSGLGFLVGALTLGGGLLICGFFSIKMLWHGVIGAGVLALLGFGRGLLNLPDAAKFIVGVGERGSVPLLELAITLLCAILLTRILAAWNRDRMRKLREEN